jgi:hypothetical protein
VKSHHYDYDVADIARLTAGPLVVALLFVIAVHAAAWLKIFPVPRPTLDVDRTILIHQAGTARRENPAQILLMGDSSCLMDVNARQLTRELGVPALNLGTLSFLSLDEYGALLRHYVAANPDRLRAVVLLMNPEALRRVGPEDYYVSVLNSFWADQDFCHAATFDDRLACWLGVEIVRGRIMARALPIALGGAFGRDYGFSRDLEAFMDDENGSVIDPVREKPRGRAEFRLAPTLKLASRNFKASAPRGTKLLVGITPIPRIVGGSNYNEVRETMLKQWAGWLEADGVLGNLPAVLPEEDFARPAHLDGAAVPNYTRRVAEGVGSFVK